MLIPSESVILKRQYAKFVGVYTILTRADMSPKSFVARLVINNYIGKYKYRCDCCFLENIMRRANLHALTPYGTHFTTKYYFLIFTFGVLHCRCVYILQMLMLLGDKVWLHYVNVDNINVHN